MPDAQKTPAFQDKRRQHVRTAVRMSAEVHVGQTTFTATTRDLSEGGCGLELSELLVENSQVTLGLFLVIDDVEEERNPPLWVKGRVVWSGELDQGPDARAAGNRAARAVAGIRFEVITDQQKAWVRQVLAHLAPMAAVEGS